MNVKRMVVSGSVAFSLALTPALAYLDPNSGSIILQILIGGIATAAIVIKSRWYKLKSLFSKQEEPELPAKTSNAQR